jgi:hypothetical protein
MGDKKLHNEVVTETKDRKSGDRILQKNINTETKQRKIADKKEKKSRVLGDKKLQNNINMVDTNSQNRDNILQDNISNETNIRGSADNQLQNNINTVNNKVDNVSNRVDKLEKTQINIRTELKFVREKHLEVGVYSVYSTTRNTMAEVGLNIVIPVGESYQDRENTRIKARLDRLEQKVGTSAVIERTLDSKGNLKSISISQGQLLVNGKF